MVCSEPSTADHCPVNDSPEWRGVGLAQNQSCPGFRFTTPLERSCRTGEQGRTGTRPDHRIRQASDPPGRSVHQAHEKPGPKKRRGVLPPPGVILRSARTPRTAPTQYQPCWLPTCMQSATPTSVLDSVSSFHAVDHPAACPDRAWETQNPCCREPSLVLVARPLLRHVCGVVPIVPARVETVNVIIGNDAGIVFNITDATGPNFPHG